MLLQDMLWKKEKEELVEYLDNSVFKDVTSTTLMASSEEIDGANKYMSKYIKAIPVERAAVERCIGGEKCLKN